MLFSQMSLVEWLWFGGVLLTALVCATLEEAGVWDD